MELLCCLGTDAPELKDILFFRTLMSGVVLRSFTEINLTISLHYLSIAVIF